jgi:hypothetical protein
MVAGSYWPPTTALGPLHAPPACGVPPSDPIKATAASLLQTVNVPFVPAFGAVFSVTVTVAVAFVQGAVPVTV